MARIKIKDLPKDMKISEKELTVIRGGIKRGPTGIIIESGSFQSAVFSGPVGVGGKSFAPVQVCKLR